MLAILLLLTEIMMKAGGKGFHQEASTEGIIKVKVSSQSVAPTKLERARLSRDLTRCPVIPGTGSASVSYLLAQFAGHLAKLLHLAPLTSLGLHYYHWSFADDLLILCPSCRRIMAC